MAAPAGLLFAKLLMPETEVPNNEKLPVAVNGAPVNVFDAAAQGRQRRAQARAE
jgi:CNT family concentrative nucleoside transporter